MKKFRTYLLLISLLFVSISGFAQTANIEMFHGTWAETVAKAKTEKRLIFIDFYTQWCGPCLVMAETVFNQPAIYTFYNSNFVCTKIDAEVGEGIELAKKYGISSFPTFLFIDPNSEEPLHRSSNLQSVAQFLSTGKAALDPTKRSYYLIENYNRGNRERQLLIDYIYYQSSIYQTKAVNTAFNELIAGGATLTDKEIWTLFCETITGVNNPYILQVSSKYGQFCELFGKKAVDEKLAKETVYGDIKVISSLCDFEGKTFNIRLIEILTSLNAKQYDQAINLIDAMIVDPKVDQQMFINRLRYFVRVTYGSDQMPDKWFYKCLEYLRYIAYNIKDRKDEQAHQEYALSLEIAIKRAANNPQALRFLTEPPLYGKKEYSLRPDVLKAKPSSKKK